LGATWRRTSPLKSGVNYHDIIHGSSPSGPLFSYTIRGRSLLCNSMLLPVHISHKATSFLAFWMLTSTLTRTLRTRILSASKPLKAAQSKVLQATAVRTMASYKPNSGPPAHEMVYFPRMTTSLPSSSGEFRKVLFTGLYSQVVLMTIPVGGDIGDEVHTVDQALTFTSGEGKATINGKDQDVKAGDLMVVPAGTQHQFINTGETPLVRLLFLLWWMCICGRKRERK